MLKLTFVLGTPQRHSPPRSFSFSGHVRNGYAYDVSQPPPTISCDVSLPPLTPRTPPTPQLYPPPPAPHTPPAPAPPLPPAPPPFSTCNLGAAFTLETQWNGGFRASVMLATWRPAATMRLDFGTSSGSYTVSTVKNARVGGKCELAAGSAMVCDFVLGSEPDSSHGFTFVARGGGGIISSPRLSCDDQRGAGSSPLATASVGARASHYPPIPPLALTARNAKEEEAIAACGLGPILTIQTRWQAGYRAAVRVVHWAAGAMVRLRLSGPAAALDVLTVYGATLHPMGRGVVGGGGEEDDEGAEQERRGPTYIFELGAQPDRAYDGFGFTSRGQPPAIDSVRFSCPTVTMAMLTSPPPPPDCLLGAEFKYVDTWASGFECEVRVRSWRGGAQFRLDFASIANGASGSPPRVEVINSWRAALVASGAADAAVGGDGGAMIGEGERIEDEQGGAEQVLAAEHAAHRERKSGRQHASSSVLVVLVDEPAGDRYTSFKLTMRLVTPSSTTAAVPSFANGQLASPTVSCTVPSKPPPPPPSNWPANAHGAWRPPDQPVPPRVLRASCASLEISWTAPEDYGWSIEECESCRSSRPQPTLPTSLHQPSRLPLDQAHTPSPYPLALALHRIAPPPDHAAPVPLLLTHLRDSPLDHAAPVPFSLTSGTHRLTMPLQSPSPREEASSLD